MPGTAMIGFHSGGGNDIIAGGGGNDTIDGGADNDTALFANAVVNYNFQINGSDILVTGASEGTDTVLDTVELLQFGGEILTRAGLLAGLTPPAFTENADVVTLPFLGGTFNALAGDDQLSYTEGSVTINGGDGTDTVDFSAFGSAVWASLGYPNHQIWTQDRADLSGGNWRVIGDLSNVENLVGTPFSDFLQGDGNANVLSYTGGLDTLDGEAGADAADFSPFGSAVWVDLTYSGPEAWTRDTANLTSGTWREIADLAGMENLVGTAQADFLAGDANANRLEGGGGGDTLIGRGGDDILGGGADNDTAVFANAAASYAFQINGSDILVTGASEGTDTVLDTVELLQFGGEILTRAGLLAGLTPPAFTENADVVTLPFLGGTFNALAGDDRLSHTGGSVTINGGDGTDTVDFSLSGSAIWVDLTYAGREAWTQDATDLVSGTWREIADLSNVENLVGTVHSDLLRGDSASNVLAYTGGLDTLDGNLGVDTVDFSAFGSAIWVDLTYAGREAWTQDATDLVSGTWREIADLSSLENVVGTVHSDLLRGDSASNVLAYTGGLDTLDGNLGVDTVDFSAFGSAIWVDLTYAGREAWTQDATDLVSGTWREIADLSSLENVVGTGHADLIRGENNANRLEGGAGNDTLMGRGGNDTFVFKDGWGNDAVTDFSDGNDLIDLTGVTGLDNFAQLTISNGPNGAGVVFDGQLIELTGINSAQLTSLDFLI